MRIGEIMEYSLKNLDLVDNRRTFKMPTYSFVLRSTSDSRTAMFPCLTDEETETQREIS